MGFTEFSVRTHVLFIEDYVLRRNHQASYRFFPCVSFYLVVVFVFLEMIQELPSCKSQVVQFRHRFTP